MRFTGKTAIVTGAANGIGRGCAERLLADGARVAALDVDIDAGRAMVEELSSRGEIVFEECDVGRKPAVDRAVGAVIERFGAVDILVNNAGINHPQAIDAISDDLWDRTLEVNLTSIMRLTRALVPQMKDRKWGRIIHISSVLGLGSKPGRNSYSATKAALIGLAKASALDLGPFGITVNCLCPGPFLTDMPLNLLSREQQQEFSDITALKRWAQPRELAGPAIFLASEAGSYVTGEALLVDGGAFARAL